MNYMKDRQIEILTLPREMSKYEDLLNNDHVDIIKTMKTTDGDTGLMSIVMEVDYCRFPVGYKQYRTRIVYGTVPDIQEFRDHETALKSAAARQSEHDKNIAKAKSEGGPPIKEIDFFSYVKDADPQKSLNDLNAIKSNVLYEIDIEEISEKKGILFVYAEYKDYN